MLTTMSRTVSTSLGERPMLGSSMRTSRGRAHERAGHRQHLLLAPGKAPGALVAPLLEDREVLVHLLDVGLHLLRVLAQVGAHLDVVEHAHRGDHHAALGDVGHPELEDLVGPASVDPLPVEA